MEGTCCTRGTSHLVAAKQNNFDIVYRLTRFWLRQHTGFAAVHVVGLTAVSGGRLCNAAPHHYVTALLYVSCYEPNRKHTNMLIKRTPCSANRPPFNRQ